MTATPPRCVVHGSEPTLVAPLACVALAHPGTTSGRLYCCPVAEETFRSLPVLTL